MDGAALAAKRKQDADISLAWHTAAFNAATKGKKGLGKLSSYLDARKPAKAQTAAEMLEVFREFQARGAGMKISRVVH